MLIEHCWRTLPEQMARNIILADGHPREGGSGEGVGGGGRWWRREWEEGAGGSREARWPRRSWRRPPR